LTFQKKSSNLALKIDKMPVEYNFDEPNLADNIVAEPGTVYQTREEHTIYNPDFFNNKFEVVQFINSGVKLSIFLKIKETCALTDTEWAQYLDISLKTLQRYTKDEAHIFKPIHSEKIIELLEVMNFGNTVFDTAKQFHLWLKTANYALGKAKPIALLKHSYGKELVMEALNRIEHGIFV